MGIKLNTYIYLNILDINHTSWIKSINKDKPNINPKRVTASLDNSNPAL